MPAQPYIPVDDLLTLEFLTDGTNNGLDTLLMEGQVSFELNKIPSAKFTFIGSNADVDQETAQPTGDLKKGQSIEVKVKVDNRPQTLFKGFIKSIEKRISESSVTLKIECKDDAYQLTKISEERENNSQTFEDKLKLFTKDLTLSETLSGKEWGQENISHNVHTIPWDYLVGFLDSIGMMVKIRNGEFNALDLLEAVPEEKYVAENGINVFVFSGREDESIKLSKASIEYWDPSSQSMEKIEAEQEAENNIKTLTLNESRFLSSTVTRMANTFLKKSAHSVIQGHVTTFGNLEAKAGDFLICNKLSREIDQKKLLISKEFHTFENASWKTEYTLGLESVQSFAETNSPSIPSQQAQTGQTNSVSGLLIGVVTQIEEDPDTQFRIKVRIPTLSENGEGVWARLSNVFSGNEMGSFFIPNVDDEVIVGCLGNNPDTPIILGSLYSSQNAMPFPIEKENHTKAFLTKEGTKIQLDDEKKSIELSTKKGNKLLISDDEKGFVLEDENGNKILMNADGITLDSSKDLILKAKMDFKMDSAKAALSASATMDVKGSIIKLN
ncbi:Actin cross-linking toxin VgrG1 [Chryseobacterium aquaeductus]|uniref:Actin cross-linking toxin VgrG1 n=1 Tax=Chryseobacterium aquaeductus TaxID=2675056 RepID=A0A9N8MDN4_9FLAO|nr:phage baseplate assembly protein V [Chryseobacterium aquaeductus]CAA7329619.1 Actin cross-linking toxin VgrG1 [Chryseobacterium potabilaquae]CAD7797970.1 Actin cross-linking toxin VgrG1 [Chryseobacterium aquaeductus]